MQPIPAGPVSTTRPDRPSATLRTASASWASSRSRPKNAMRGRIVGTSHPGRAHTAGVTDTVARPQRAVHPSNTLNELTGDEWLYLTKSLLTTAYPSELGHVERRAHGANKPPRLMARLIEFFSRGDELVLDPFAGVGGTLLGAAICRVPRRALGFEIEPRWAGVYEALVAAVRSERDGRGPLLRDLGDSDPGGPRTFDASGCRMLVGDAADPRGGARRRERGPRRHRPAL